MAPSKRDMATEVMLARHDEQIKGRVTRDACATNRAACQEKIISRIDDAEACLAVKSDMNTAALATRITTLEERLKGNGIVQTTWKDEAKKPGTIMGGGALLAVLGWLLDKLVQSGWGPFG